MRVYINRKPVTGPWGGGNKTLLALVDSLRQDHDVTFDLDETVDVIYCQDPKPGPDGLWYQDFLDHRSKFGSRIVQRVGDVGTHRGPQVTQLVRESTLCSDIVIFPSDWAREEISFNKSNYYVVHNAPNDDFYAHRDTGICLSDSKKVRIITHHWATNDMKGFDIYEALGKYALANENVDFCYVGRYSEKFSTTGIDLIAPKDVGELSKILPRYDIYLTASMLEAGANHVLEGLACGLPVLFREGGGSIDEYCSPYGIRYRDFEQLIACIDFMKSKYVGYKSQVLKYSTKISDVIDTYTTIINTLE